MGSEMCIRDRPLSPTMLFISLRWGCLYAMFEHILRLYTSLHTYFNRNDSHHALYPTEWQAVVQVVSVLDEAAVLSKQIQGGRLAFVAQAINDFATLHASVSAPVQEMRCLDPWDGDKKEVAVDNLKQMVRDLLTMLVEDMVDKIKPGSASNTPEKINLVLDCRFKSWCPAVCLNGGEELQKWVEADVKLQFGFFGNTTSGTMEQSDASTAGAGGVTSAGLGQGRAASGVDSGREGTPQRQVPPGKSRGRRLMECLKPHQSLR